MPRHPRPWWCTGRLLGQQAGLTLVDVVVAMVIGSLALLALAAVLPLASSADQQGWQQSQAAAIAEDLFEQMRLTPYANLNSTTFPDHTTVTGYTGFSYSVTFAADSPVTNTTTVTVTAMYTPVRNATLSASVTSPDSVSFTTILAAPAT